ncbi:hypothetical protein G5I_00683 [Acromyrmex echinatior]|uniref:DUF4817 domain-containing protein n=1 Tax=Acromyrmex echinatior TaxID=103372 RepID=F4W5I6_ACREC|nr:hypothetical protein G5I_00683 [Acromyrmex echinatior]
MVNCVGDIFLHKYVLLHMSYHSHNRKQSDKVKVKVTKSKINFSSDVAAGQLACIIHTFSAKLFQSIKIGFMPKFTNFEMADMHFAYGLANNSRETRRIYAERHPQCNLPCRKIFANIHRYLREKSSFVKNTDLGKPMTVRTPEEAVLNEIEAHSERNTRKIARALNSTSSGDLCDPLILMRREIEIIQKSRARKRRQSGSQSTTAIGSSNIMLSIAATSSEVSRVKIHIESFSRIVRASRHLPPSVVAHSVSIRAIAP